MEKICLENILSGLMFLGFDKVDSLLLSYATQDVLKSNIYRFVLNDDAITSLYNYIEFKDGVYKFFDGENLETDIKLKNLSMPMKTFLALNSNKKIIECLKKIDYGDIVLKKIECIGLNNINSMNHLFSSKEKEIIMNIFGITLNNSKVLKK